MFAPILFKVIDAKTEDTLDSATFVINGSKIESVFLKDIYIIKPPFSNSATNFELVVLRDGYNDKHDVYEVENLYKDGKPEPLTIRLERLQRPGEFTTTLEWDGKTDFDSHMMIFDDSMNLLLQDEVVSSRTATAMLYFDNRCEDFGTWSGNSGYVNYMKQNGITNKPCSAIRCDGIFYELDYDNLGDYDKGNVEHISGRVSLDENRIYRFIIYKYNRGGTGFKDSKARVTIMLNNKEHHIKPINNKMYWILFDIKKVNRDWVVGLINDCTDTIPQGFLSQNNVDDVQQCIKTYASYGTIQEGITNELTFTNNKNGLEAEFTPSSIGKYQISLSIIECVGYPIVWIYTKKNGVEKLKKKISGLSATSMNVMFSINSQQDIQTYTMKFALWTGNNEGGKFSINITKTS